MMEVKLYIVAKNPRRPGSVVYDTKTKEEANDLYSSCNLSARGFIEVVLLGSNETVLDVYGEYKPYTFVNSPVEFIQACARMTTEASKDEELLTILDNKGLLNKYDKVRHLIAPSAYDDNEELLRQVDASLQALNIRG